MPLCPFALMLKKIFQKSGRRFGLLIVSASLLAAFLVIFFVLDQGKKANNEALQRQGYRLVRLLSRIEPAGTSGPGAILSKARHALAGIEDEPCFAFLTVVDGNGTVLARVAPAGAALPAFTPSHDPSFWFYEQGGRKNPDGRTLLEFGAPLLKNNDLLGHLVLGFFEPGLDIAGRYRDLLSDIFLPIFLLGALFYFMFKRETRGITDLSDQIRTLKDSDNPGFNVSIKGSGEAKELANDLHKLLEKNISRLREIEEEHARALDSSKVIQYKKNRLEAIFEEMPDGMAVLDDSGDVTYVNSKFVDLLDLDKTGILGSNFLQWSNVLELTTFFARYQGGRERLKRAGEICFSPESRPDTSIMVLAVPLARWEEKSVSGILVIARDVSAEMLARRAREEFLSQVSHEFKAPLNVIKIYNEMLLGEDGKNETFRIEAINTIDDAVERLNMMIKNLLSISQIEMGSIVIKRIRVKLSELLKDVFEVASSSDRAGRITFNLDLPKKLSHVNVDKELLTLALNNLLTNAVKYNRPDGSVNLSAEENAEQLLIRVSDTGIGISPEDSKRIFEKFYRSESDEVREREGHGLGLSLARDIVELHHGRLLVESAPGEGSVFTIALRKTDGLISDKI